MARAGIIPKLFILLVLFAGIVGLQSAYDHAKPAAPVGQAGVLPPSMVRLADLGFHSAVASFLWIPTMPEILDLFSKHYEFIDDLAYVNGIDPKMSYPYAFSVLTLPAVANFPDAVKDALIIGQRGLAGSDPDWRIPYYMATDYYLDLKDTASAQKYYDIAAHTPGVPGFAARFSLNFGIASNEREKTKELWTTIRDSTNDQDTKDRAQGYIDRLTIFDYLEAASKAYKVKFGTYPSTPQDLVTKGLIPEVPQDPFGFTFVINKDGTVGIDTLSLPAYLQNSPQQ